MNTVVKKILALSLISLSIASTTFAHGVSPVKAFELSLHKLESLIAQKKIDKIFELSIQNLKMELIPTTDPNNDEEPAFKTTITLYPGADGTQKALVVILDEEGRKKGYETIKGANPVNAPVWSDKDSATLSEYALHYILDSAKTNPELDEINDGATGMTLSQGEIAPGVTGAIVDVITGKGKSSIKILIKQNGNILSSKIIPATMETNTNN